MKIILRSYSGADYGPESLTALISAIFGDFMTIFGIYVWRKCMRKWHPKSEAVATYFACRRHPPETGFTIRYAKWSALEKSVAARAVNNYGPESAPEYDRSMIFISGHSSSGSGYFPWRIWHHTGIGSTPDAGSKTGTNSTMFDVKGSEDA